MDVWYGRKFMMFILFWWIPDSVIENCSVGMLDVSPTRRGGHFTYVHSIIEESPLTLFCLFFRRRLYCSRQDTCIVVK